MRKESVWQLLAVLLWFPFSACAVKDTIDVYTMTEVTEGRVLEVNTVGRKGGSEITYAYRVGGQAFEGETEHPDRTLAYDLQPGDAVEVHYDPSEPSESTAAYGWHSRWLGFEGMLYYWFLFLLVAAIPFAFVNGVENLETYPDSVPDEDAQRIAGFLWPAMIWGFTVFLEDRLVTTAEIWGYLGILVGFSVVAGGIVLGSHVADWKPPKSVAMSGVFLLGLGFLFWLWPVADFVLLLFHFLTAGEKPEAGGSDWYLYVAAALLYAGGLLLNVGSLAFTGFRSGTSGS